MIYKETSELSPEFINEMVEVLKKAFLDSRAIIMGSAGNVNFTRKQDGSPVTVIDQEVEDFVTKKFSSSFPDVPIFGEESGYEDKLPQLCWLIDPLDGTKSFIKGVPAFTCMAVLISNEQSVASVIYNPTNQEMFTAVLGGGAYKNGEKLDLKEMPLPKIVYCKSQHIEVLKPLLAKKGIVAVVGPSGAGYGFSEVANNKTAARFHLHSGGHIHDHAPGALLIKEAGGQIISILDQDYTYRTRSFVACHPELTEIVRSNIEILRNLEDPDQKLN